MRRTCSFRRRVETPYSCVKSLSNITFCPRIKKIRRSIDSTGMTAGQVVQAFLPKRIGPYRQSAKKRILFLPHAVHQMSRPDRMITPSEVRNIVKTGEVIEDYPRDARGHSCLILGRGDEGRAVHVVCAPKEDFLAIITAYLPSEAE